MPKDLHAASTMARVFASVFSLPAYRGRIRLDKFALAHQSVTVTETIAMLLAAGLSLVELHVMETKMDPRRSRTGSRLRSHTAAFEAAIGGFEEPLSMNVRRLALWWHKKSSCQTARAIGPFMTR